MITTIYFEVIDSTNTEAKRIINGKSENMAQAPFVLIANAQTSGRGRQGRTFYSPADTGIYLMLVFAGKNHLFFCFDRKITLQF